MRDIYIIGTACSAFGKFPDKSFKDFAREAVHEVVGDAGLGGDSGISRIGSVWFANCLASMWGQSMIRGQVALRPLFEEGALPPGIPVTNIESACASGSKALLAACTDVLSGQAPISLAVGVEKLCMPEGNEPAIAAMYEAYDTFDPREWQAEHRRRALSARLDYSPSPGHAVTMDTYALMAGEHMARFGTTREQIAAAAAKNHNHGAANPKAQYRFEMTPESVLEDREIIAPLTRAMCAPIGDGAAAALVCDGDMLARLPPETRSRAIRIRGFGQASGRFRSADEESITSVAGRRAYRTAGISPENVDIVELHDAASVAEIIELENLGMFEPGQAAPAVEAGATSLGGELPVNLSGGLVSKGHPVGATGLSMVYEMCLQLRGEAGQRQAGTPAIGLIENGGGIIGMEAAACVVTIIERPADTSRN